jgi:hypothetical protein
MNSAQASLQTEGCGSSHLTQTSGSSKQEKRKKTRVRKREQSAVGTSDIEGEVCTERS